MIETKSNNLKIKVGLLTAGFINWQGGIDFLKYVIKGLKYNERYEIVLLIPDRNNLTLKCKNNFKKKINQYFNKNYKIIKYPPVTETVNYLIEYLEVQQVKVYKENIKLHRLVNNNYDILLPSFYPIDNKVTPHVISYLYDFQYKYFPEYFPQKEIKHRDEYFAKHVISSRNIIVNAMDVKKDVKKFYSRNDCVHVLPFTPIFNAEKYFHIPNCDEINKKYNLKNKPYFFISNQFWPHKGHLTAFKSLDILINNFGLDLTIVCSGEFPDSNNSEYCKEIDSFIKEHNLINKVQFVGFVSKIDQLGLLLNSCALVQPTQFEGGPGGFSVFEALAYKQYCIISDIEVNKEISSEDLVSYFKVNDSFDLAIKIKAHMSYPKSDRDFEELKKNSEYRLLRLGAFWDGLIDNILNK